jgi:DNA-binding transcriptional MerR regulator
MGLSLAEIGELLEIQDRGACPCGHTKALVERHLAEIDAQMIRLSRLRNELASSIGQTLLEQLVDMSKDALRPGGDVARFLEVNENRAGEVGNRYID